MLLCLLWSLLAVVSPAVLPPLDKRHPATLYIPSFTSGFLPMDYPSYLRGKFPKESRQTGNKYLPD